MGGGPSTLLDKPWKALPKNNQESLHFMKWYKPRNKEASHLRILLHGPVGAGKSSFINSVDSVLQSRVTGRALTDATSGGSFTKEYKTYKISNGPDTFYSFVFNDIMGLEQKANNGVHVEDIKLALRGHVRDGYKFNSHPLTEGDPSYNPSPKLDDRVHILVSVIPADSVSLISDEVIKKMREVRLAASAMGIPQVAILTKVDKACAEAKQDIRNVYKSRYLDEQVNTFSELLGLQANCIFLVKNYAKENDTQDDTDALILCALRQMINYGEDFLNDL
ncbi:interferon-induced protein 44-like [Acanthopagrus latus]|uniref:interferon-induced protein 44-like n=1 Tax=Acanthopagrus latus TaxID=8177 RepID=UPI00187BC8CA|nr:interferon-induced protein 44-like [Acanthopagrus latus]XP_036943619.1 interferon-induced protein 44-like [Acanthopagrus latus]XP_036943620.1 interferon-induced protein 44-like [Acanthopagrus latus]